VSLISSLIRTRNVNAFRVFPVAQPWFSSDNNRNNPNATTVDCSADTNYDNNLAACFPVQFVSVSCDPDLEYFDPMQQIYFVHIIYHRSLLPYTTSITTQQQRDEQQLQQLAIASTFQRVSITVQWSFLSKVAMKTARVDCRGQSMAMVMCFGMSVGAAQYLTFRFL